MKRKILPFIAILLIVAATGAVIALAGDETPSVGAGQVHEGDFISGSGSVTIDGTVTGDVISLSQDLTVSGTVEGDIISSALDIRLSGPVGGSVRVAGNTIAVSSKVTRNLMAIGSVTVNKDAVILKNVYLSGSRIKFLGTAEGNADINGAMVTLGGTFKGNVTIRDMTENSTLEILPGTVISGKLTYEGIKPYSVPSGVAVKQFEFVKINLAGGAAQGFDVMNLVKKIITLLVYYLFALLLYKIFPRFFTRSGDFISKKPLSAAGIGIATLGTFVGSLLLLFILCFLATFVFNVSIFAFTGLVLFFVGVATVVFAELPVSLWLGGMMAGRGTVPAKLALGLAAVSIVKYMLDYLRELPAAGSVFGVAGVLFRAVIWLLGTGAILKIVLEMFRSANRQAEAEELETQEL